MQRKNLVDEYFNKQPSRTFIDDLRTREVRLIQSIDDEKSGYVMVQNAFLNISQFDSPSLKTAYDAFNAFLRDNNRTGEGFSFVFRKDENLATSDYKLKTMSDTCLISASDEDGIRRATVRLMDDILAQGGFLKKGFTHGKCKIKDRVTRCYFSPTNRPPKNGDELLDSIDYYPEHYLERLSYNGITAIWIYTDFNSILTSSYIKEFGKDGEKRLEKLNKVIDKCEKYAIIQSVIVIITDYEA